MKNRKGAVCEADVAGAFDFAPVFANPGPAGNE